jgi:hypothetical protein
MSRAIRQILTLNGMDRGKQIFVTVAFCDDGTIWQSAPVIKNGSVTFCTPSRLTEDPQMWSEGWEQIGGRSAIPDVVLQ